MKFTVLKDNFLKGLNIVGKAINARAPVPILSNILIKTEKGRLVLMASGLQITISAKIGAKVDKEGEITIPAKLLIDFVSQIADEKIEASLDGSVLTLKTDKSSAKFSGAGADEFPAIETIKKGVSFDLSSKEFAKAMQYAGFTVASDEGRPVLTGLYIEAEKSGILFAGTDGFRMAEYKMKLAKSIEEKVSFIVPARSFIEVGRALLAESESVSLTVDSEKNLLVLKVDDFEAYFRMIDGEYPDYRSIIPSDFTTEVHVSRADFENGVKLSNIFSRDSGNMIKLIVGKKGIQSMSQPSESGSNTTNISAEVTGEDVEIAFNAKYLLEFFASISDDEIVFKISDSLKPGLFKLEGKDHYFYIVMPMKANW